MLGRARSIRERCRSGRLGRLATPVLLAALACSVPAPPPESAAESPLDGLPDDSAGEIVRRSIAYAGGWDAYQSTRSVAFRKTRRWYAADGSLEGERVEHHSYALRPRMRALIEYREQDRTVLLANDGYYGWKLVDGELATTVEETNQARNSTFGSHYVFHMPFKLADPGTRLEHVGRHPLEDGTIVESVRVSYGEGVGDAGGLHTWTYHFDAGSGRLVANLLQHSGGYSYTEYLDDTPVGAMRLSTKRHGYAADEDGKRGPRTSQIVYDEIETGVELDESLCVRPPGVPGAP